MRTLKITAVVEEEEVVVKKEELVLGHSPFDKCERERMGGWVRIFFNSL